MQRYIDMVEDALKDYVKESDLPQKKIYDAMAYSLLAGGKRLRPVIMMMTAEMLGKNANIVLPFAAALEMIHTSSLIHDDLPSMDNDDLRRGRPTNHKVFGEAMAILAGDALLNHASQIMTEAVAESCDSGMAKAAREITYATGIFGMIGGQTIDVLAEKTGLDIASEAMLTRIHSMKTCALLQCAVASGAYIAGADDEAVKKWKQYGLYLGMAFQIIDDILDVVGDEVLLGKPVGSDSQNGKPTFVTLMGLDGAMEKAEEYTQKAKKTAESLGADFFVWLAEYLCDRKY